jgi:hypothetical protein
MDIPPDWFVEHLINLQQAVAINTGLANGFSITVSADLGPRIGIAPGGVMHIMGPAGVIHINAMDRKVEPCTSPYCELAGGHSGAHEFKLRVR